MYGGFSVKTPYKEKMIIGIDLGTTNSLVSYFAGGKPHIIPNRLHKNLTPSVVSIDEKGQVFVGETAQERQMLYPESAASVFKRSMGSDKKFRLNDDEYTAEELSSFVLRALKEDAEAFLGETVEEAVISVPAYFNDARRKATKRAGELAGFKVERIISEPTAAAVAHGLYQKKENTKFLVFDLGGGTFDVSILERFHNILEVRAVAGDNFLGGEDFTDALVQIFLTETGLGDRLFDERTAYHIIRQAEKCKLGFSGANCSLMRCQIDGQWRELEISLKDYEMAVQPLLERIRKPIKRSLADSNIKLSEIDEVVLVGGATKLPVIKRFISKLFERIIHTSNNPDEAVALGAAIQAAMKERNETVKEVILTDVCPFTLGTEVVVERESGWMENGHFCPIIERNTVIPASRTERLYTVRNNQTKIRINILQGESRFAANNLSLGELFIDVPGKPAGEEAVDVTYTYDINSILEVEAEVISTGKKKKQIIKGSDNSMTDEEVQARMEELRYLKIHPRKQEENKLLVLKGERLYEESAGAQRRRIELMLRAFEEALDSQNPERISAARKDFERKLKEEQDAMNGF